MLSSRDLAAPSIADPEDMDLALKTNRFSSWYQRTLAGVLLRRRTGLVALLLTGCSLLFFVPGHDGARADLLVRWDVFASLSANDGGQSIPDSEPMGEASELWTAEDTPLVAATTDFVYDLATLAPPFTLELTASPKHGCIQLGDGGGFTYSPDRDYTGADSFSFRLRNARGQSLAGNVALFVEPRNDPPMTAPLLVTCTAGEELRVGAPGVLDGASDPDGDALWVSLATPPLHGEASLDGDGGFTYVAEAGFTGEDSFTFEVSDGTEETAAAVHISVQPPPPVTLVYDPTDDAMVSSNSANTAFGSETQLWLQDGAATSRSYVKFSVQGLGGVVERATLRLFCLDSSRDGGRFVPVANEYRRTRTAWSENLLSWNNAPILGGVPHRLGTVAAGTWVDIDVTGLIHGDGVYSFGLASQAADVARYSSKEGTHPPQLEIVTVVEREPGDLDPVAMDDLFEVTEDTPFEAFSMGLLENDTDEDGDFLYVVSRSQPSHGVLIVGEDGSFVYRPDPHYNGPDSFTYTISDLRGGMDTGTVALTVLPVEDAPVAVADTWVLLSSGSLSVASPGVLANDSDADGEALSAELLTDVSHGQLVLAEDGAFSYTPDEGFAGTDTFVYAAHDGTDSSPPVLVTLGVTPQDKAGKARAGQEPIEETLLERVFPNPFGNGTWIDYRLGHGADVEASVFDVRGQRVRLLTAGRQSPGSRSLYWNGLDDRGLPVPAGIYFLQLQLGDARRTRKLVRQR